MRPTALKRAAGIVAAPTVVLYSAPAAVASAAPRNDDFLDAIPVQVGSNVRGKVKGATKERGEHRHAESVARHSVWYRFRATRKVTVVFGTCRSNFDTVVAVYTGGEVTSLRRSTSTTTAAAARRPREAVSASPRGPESPTSGRRGLHARRPLQAVREQSQRAGQRRLLLCSSDRCRVEGPRDDTQRDA